MKKILVAVLALSALSAQAATVTFYGDKFHGKKTASGERFNQGRARVIIEKVDDLIAQDTQSIKSSTLAQDSLSAKKVAEMLSQVEKVSTSHTTRITLASNTPVTE